MDGRRSWPKVFQTLRLRKGWSQPKARPTGRAGLSRKTPGALEGPVKRLEDEFENIFQK